MNSEEMKKCPYCAEMIKAEALKCRYCGSNLSGKSIWQGASSDPQFWRRVNKGKKIAGVCAGIERQLDAPILLLPLRLFFVLTTVFYGFGLILYIVLWILMPPPADRPGQGKNAAGASAAAPRQPSEESAPSPAESGVEPSSREESAAGEAPSPEEESRPIQMKGPMLLLLAGAALFLVFLVLNGWGFLNHPLFNFLHIPVLPLAEWIKLLVVLSVALVILAGMNVISPSAAAIILISAAAIYFSEWTHFVSLRVIIASIVIGCLLWAGYLIVRKFSRSPGTMKCL